MMAFLHFTTIPCKHNAASRHKTNNTVYILRNPGQSLSKEQFLKYQTPSEASPRAVRTKADPRGPGGNCLTGLVLGPPSLIIMPDYFRVMRYTDEKHTTVIFITNVSQIIS